MDSNIDKYEKETFVKDDNPELPPSDIVAYNESRSCADLHRMYQDGVLKIQPEFQREIVWKGPAQTRFIDSLIKHLPIPSLCFSLDYKTERWQVIDGLQRMASIIRFLNGDPQWRLSALDDIDPDLSGKQAKAFLDPDSPLHKYYSRVKNLTIPITVLRCDLTKKTHTNYLFTIFHRLNTEGMKLNNQEIRNCIYLGSFNDLLKDLNKYPNWMKLNRMNKNDGYRFTKEELILRFFAFHDDYENYTGRLAKYLNEYMNDNRDIDQAAAIAKTELFERTVDIVYKSIYNAKGPAKTPISVVEAALIGVSRNIESLETEQPSSIKHKYNTMLQKEDFADDKLSEGLSGKQRVLDRLSAAIDSFS
jgi:hypothetical protein